MLATAVKPRNAQESSRGWIYCAFCFDLKQTNDITTTESGIRVELDRHRYGFMALPGISGNERLQGYAQKCCVPFVCMLYVSTALSHCCISDTFDASAPAKVPQAIAIGLAVKKKTTG